MSIEPGPYRCAGCRAELPEVITGGIAFDTIKKHSVHDSVVDEVYMAMRAIRKREAMMEDRETMTAAELALLTAGPEVIAGNLAAIAADGDLAYPSVHVPRNLLRAAATIIERLSEAVK